MFPMPETITVTQDQREVVRGLLQDSILTCTKLSAPDVYVALITSKETTDLYHVGDSTTEPRLTRVRFYLFRKNVDATDPFSATVSIEDAPAPKYPPRPDHSLAVQFHLPDGSSLLTGAVGRAKKSAPRKKRRT
jgi:hypothetical protein